jgi:hypothetical protein
MDGIEVKGLAQPPDRFAKSKRKKFNPKKRGFFGKAGKGRLRGKMFGPKEPKGLRGFNPKKRGFFGKRKPKPRKFGPVFRSKLAGRGPKSRKPRGSARRARQSTARGGRRPKSSWLMKMAMRALKRSVKSAAPRDFRNHGFKGVKHLDRTGLAGRR